MQTEVLKRKGHGNRKASYRYVIDNTPFPFPEGAFSYSNITISLTNYIQFTLNDTYETMGVRLIYINVTILLIYGFTLTVLVCKNARTEKKMQSSEPVPRESLDIKLRENYENDSDIDNY